jgi:hypothetical protein
MNISNIKKDNALNIWLLTDGKLGHTNQTEGLAKALANYRQIKIIRPPLATSSQAIRMWLLKWCDKKIDQVSPDLIIGAGHQTHLSLLAYKKCFGGKVVVMMSPSLPHGFFDLCFIPRHDNPRKKDNVIETLGAINRVVPNQSSHTENTGLILLGGPSKHYQWKSNKIVKQIQKLLIEKPHTQWVIASSRRTPITFYDEIKAQFPGLELITPENTSVNWLSEKMLEVQQIWVTADSVSMIYEALTSGAQTGILELDYDKPSRLTREMDRLLNEKIAISLNSSEQVSSASFIYEADRCAKLLLKKFNL